jgi:hypothetical protein
VVVDTVEVVLDDNRDTFAAADTGQHMYTGVFDTQYVEHT